MEYEDDEQERRQLEYEEREKKRYAYGILILLVCGIYVFGGLIIGSHISVAEAIISGALCIYALHLLGIV